MFKKISFSLNQIGSFHICNDEEGGNQLNFDITNFYAWKADVPPNVLESHINVCSCVNVPQYVQDMEEWSINNHHNDLYAYYEPDCTEEKMEPIFIAAGNNWDTRNMYNHIELDGESGLTYKIKSLGPDPQSAYFQNSCVSSHITMESNEVKITTESTNGVEGTMESEMDTVENLNNKEVEVLTSQILDLQIQVGQIKRNQETFQAEFIDQLRNFTYWCNK